MDSRLDRRRFQDLSYDIEELEAMLAELLEASMNYTFYDSNNPVKLSFVMRFDEEGFPKIESFSKARYLPTANGNPIEPISRVEEDNVNYVITLDLLGHEKNEIEAFLERNYFVIVSRTNRPFFKKFFLKNPVDPAGITRNLKNNVLEIVLKKMPEPATQ